jgi:hypothetical protein
MSIKKTLGFLSLVACVSLIGLPSDAAQPGGAAPKRCPKACHVCHPKDKAKCNKCCKEPNRSPKCASLCPK